jgi:tetratricopeptide (TPR) repeat protein
MRQSTFNHEIISHFCRQMNEYLAVFPTDVDAWRELGDMNLEIQNIEAAKFAFEEVLMLSPINHVSHTTLADCFYTLGDFVTARKYFSQSLELKPTGNARAALGLILCTTAINSSRSSKAEDKASTFTFYMPPQIIRPILSINMLGMSSNVRTSHPCFKAYTHTCKIFVHGRALPDTKGSFQTTPFFFFSLLLLLLVM